MNVSGEFTVNAPRGAVYKALRDATSFVRFVDGVQDLKQIDSTH
jgi:carbon monoxide dehydrogenase subunit G